MSAFTQLNELVRPKTGEPVPIPDDIIAKVVAALLRFKVICSEFNVAKKHIRIIATEATRTAINSVQYRKEIKDATSIKVEMLAKEEEGFMRALGVASGFSDVTGLVMDLGGSVSFPYGAAALTKKLEALRDGKSTEESDKAVAKFRAEIKTNFTNAYSQLGIPEEMIQKAIKEGGFPLYLSGGGFRGWGYLLLYMSQTHGRDYPISLINGFSAPKSDFKDVERLKKVAR
ncbi:hypothetical protein V499_00014 [Pseudogymnoascus sp. VKM F-103]|nr:hypothetical protein V499_00014 [Pseudogymnoascus sp. VKM F-103]